MLLRSQPLRLARYPRRYCRLQSVHQPPPQMSLPCWYSRLPQLTSYCVELTLRRLCSTVPAEPIKAKRGKKSEAKSKKQTPSSDASSVEGEEAPGKKKKKVKTGGKKTLAQILADHVAQEPAPVQELLHQYRVQLNRRKTDPERLYIINESIADSVVQHIAGQHLDVPHLEMSPGPGVLTRRLLEAGVQRVIGFEPSPVFQPCVTSLSEQTDGAVHLTPLNLLQLSKFYGAETHGDETRVKQAVEGLTRREWSDGPCLRVVGVAHRSIFFQFLIRSIIGRDHIFQFGRPELLVFVPEAEYARLSAGPSKGGRLYRPYSILSRMLFDLEPLHRVPSKHFYPWMQSGTKVEFTETEMVLIRFTPKKDSGVPESELHNLDFFVRECAVTRSRRIVQHMEEWVPGCGPRLIALGHGVFSPFRELEPEQILDLFLEFTSWPEYRACSFHAAVQQNMMDCESELADSDHMIEEDVHDEPEHFDTEPYR